MNIYNKSQLFKSQTNIKTQRLASEFSGMKTINVDGYGRYFPQNGGEECNMLHVFCHDTHVGISDQSIKKSQDDFAMTYDYLRLICIYQMMFCGSLFFNQDGCIIWGENGCKDKIEWTGRKEVFIDSTKDVDDAVADIGKLCKKDHGAQLGAAWLGDSETWKTFHNVGYFSEKGINANLVEESYWYDHGDIKTLTYNNKIVFTPSVSMGWIEMAEGSYVLPNGDKEYGRFSFFEESSPKNKLHCGDTFLPFLKIPGAVYVLNIGTQNEHRMQSSRDSN